MLFGNMFFDKRHIIFLFLFLACIGCAQTPDKQKNFKSIRLSGYINEYSAGNIINSINEGPKLNAIIVNSKGGNENIALKLANEITKKDIDIYVDGYCMSACAHILLPAAKNLYIAENSIVAFHTNIFGWLEFLSLYERELYEKNIQNGRKLYQFLEDQNIDVDLLFCIDALHEPENNIIYAENGKISRKTKYSYVVASDASMRKYGLNPQYLDGYKADMSLRTSEINLDIAGALSDWSIKSCQSLNFHNWNQVKKDILRGQE